MNLRKKCEHEIFIGYDERVKEYRVYIKRTKKIQVSRHIQPMDTPNVARGETPHIIKVLPTSGEHDKYDCEQIDISITLGDSSDASSDVDSSTQDKTTLAERRERRQIIKPVRYLDSITMIILRFKEPKYLKETVETPER